MLRCLAHGADLIATDIPLILTERGRGLHFDFTDVTFEGSRDESHVAVKIDQSADDSTLLKSKKRKLDDDHENDEENEKKKTRCHSRLNRYNILQEKVSLNLNDVKFNRDARPLVRSIHHMIQNSLP